ncbi:Protein FAM53B [Merluccius polli]|uniref:Protein FAM53B n=1 Tax=Merluccius polli TaxID=89951 RepID=A0AA47MTT9_MERPO|nr:Protein FAM53B [Merluccius polli]
MYVSIVQFFPVAEQRGGRADMSDVCCPLAMWHIGWLDLVRHARLVQPVAPKLRNFQSLSCPGITGEEGCQSTQAPPILRSAAPCESDFLSLSQQATEDALARTKDGEEGTSVGSDPTIEELGRNSPDYGDAMAWTTNGKDGEHLWVGLCSPRKDMYQLGGELDIEQIERN